MTQPDPTPPAGDPPAPTTPPAPAPAPPPPTPPADDKPLGPGGEKALQAERERAKALEKELAALAPLKQLAAALGGQASGNGRTDLERLTERLTQHETELATERAARYRLEVAAKKGLTPEQAGRLRGDTPEALEADADALLALFPTGPRAPAPDPSQGARGTQPPDLENLIAEAQKAGDIRKVIALQKQKLHTAK